MSNIKYIILILSCVFINEGTKHHKPSYSASSNLSIYDNL